MRLRASLMLIASALLAGCVNAIDVSQAQDVQDRDDLAQDRDREERNDVIATVAPETAPTGGNGVFLDDSDVLVLRIEEYGENDADRPARQLAIFTRADLLALAVGDELVFSDRTTRERLGGLSTATMVRIENIRGARYLVPCEEIRQQPTACPGDQVQGWGITQGIISADILANGQRRALPRCPTDPRCRK